MRPIRTFAPGKLFVMGEYLVLSGGRALVVALDAGIRCEAREGSSGWRISAPDLGLDLSLEEAATDRRGRVLASAVTAAASRFSPGCPLELRIEGTHPALRRKSGLGGSAASVVAVVSAIAAASGQALDGTDARSSLFSLARAVHADAQGGRGSGADVAASVYGGWVDYALVEGGARILPARVPAEILLAAVWTGVDADTAAALASHAMGGCDSRAGLGRPLARFWTALEGDDRSSLLEA
ncbi:MAG: mevalonate kinase family protein, partial [Candidatus Binatia bacterium]